VSATLSFLFDAFIAATLSGLALGAVLSSQLYRAVVLFITFGLVAAVAWVRLGAVDVGLAEAAVGAGVTGALLLDAAGHMGRWRDPTVGGGAPDASREAGSEDRLE
jgi:energy-converting hydrogenase B subunit D